MTPVCVKCQKMMRIVKNERFVEIVSGGESYQLWNGDEWGCKECGALIITGFGKSPFHAALHMGYAATIAEERKHGTIVTVVR